MKKTMVMLCIGLCLLSGCGKKEQEVLRFHVIGHSDSVYDQQVKMKVKNAIYDLVSAKISGAADEQQVKEQIANHREEIVDKANAVLLAEGAPYTADLEMGRFAFPTKQYGTEVFPAGEYDAVRVTLGEAKGQNWWCVMFPPICFIDAGQNEEDWSLEDVEDVEFASILGRLLRKEE